MGRLWEGKRGQQSALPFLLRGRILLPFPAFVVARKGVSWLWKKKAKHGWGRMGKRCEVLWRTSFSLREAGALYEEHTISVLICALTSFEYLLTRTGRRLGKGRYSVSMYF